MSRLFIDLQYPVHPFHIDDDSPFKGNGETGQRQACPHGDERYLFPAGKPDDLLYFLHTLRDDHIVRFVGGHQTGISGIKIGLLRLIGKIGFPHDHGK